MVFPAKRCGSRHFPNKQTLFKCHHGFQVSFLSPPLLRDLLLGESRLKCHLIKVVALKTGQSEYQIHEIIDLIGQKMQNPCSPKLGFLQMPLANNLDFWNEDIKKSHKERRIALRTAKWNVAILI